MNEQVQQQELAYLENVRLMNQIVREMKEIPELPSEKPKDINALLKVEFPEGGGILTYMENQAEPYKGFPYYEFVDKIDVIKKLGRATISGLFHSLKHRRLSLLTLIPSAWFAKDLVRTQIYTFYRVIERFRMKTHRMSTSMRDLHRAMSIPVPNEKPSSRLLREQIRDLATMFMEFDNAYRFRYQDVIVELDRHALTKNPRKELCRLFDILSSREKVQDVRDTWRLAKIVVSYYLLFDRELLNIIVHVLLRVDMNEAKLSKEDINYCTPRTDYTFGYMQPNVPSILHN